MFSRLTAVYRERKERIQQRLQDFSRAPESEYFYELCFCLLTPASNARVCHAAVESLREACFHEEDVDPSLHIRSVRFNKTKAGRLLQAKKQFPLILEKMRSLDSVALRLWLADHVDGFGLKESAHFLRNVGHRNLGILDRHVLKRLQLLRVIRSLPRSLTRKRYFLIEQKFRQFADKVGIPMDELDLLFWSLETGEVFK